MPYAAEMYEYLAVERDLKCGRGGWAEDKDEFSEYWCSLKCLRN